MEIEVADPAMFLMVYLKDFTVVVHLSDKCSPFL